MQGQLVMTKSNLGRRRAEEATGPQPQVCHLAHSQSSLHGTISTLRKEGYWQVLKISRCPNIQLAARPDPCQATIPWAGRPQWTPPQGSGHAGGAVYLCAQGCLLGVLEAMK